MSLEGPSTEADVVSRSEASMREHVSVCVVVDNHVAGGVDSFLRTLLPRLSQRVENLDVIVNSNYPNLDQFSQKCLTGARVTTYSSVFHNRWFTRVGITTRRTKALKLNAVMRRAAEYMLIPFEVLRLRRKVSVSPHAVVLVVNGGYPGSYLALAAALAFSRTNAIAMNIHSFAVKRSFPSQVEQWVIDRRVKNAVSIFIGVSEMSSRELKRRFGKYRISTATVYNSIEPPVSDLQTRYAETPRESNHVVLGLVGTLELRKGHIFALEVLAGLSRKLPSVKFSLRFIGSDPYCLRHTIEVEARRHGVTDSVTFHGFQESKDSIYSELDLVLVPSRFLESFGLVPIESLSRGIPVVASASGALPEILEGIPNSEVVETFDVADWVAAVLRLLSATPATGAASSTSKLLRFRDPEQMTDEYFDILKALHSTA